MALEVEKALRLAELIEKLHRLGANQILKPDETKACTDVAINELLALIREELPEEPAEEAAPATAE